MIMQESSTNKPVPLVDFDTHKYIKELQDSGLNSKQAEIIVKFLLESRDYYISKTATPDQISVIAKELELLKITNNEQFVSIHKDIELTYKENKESPPQAAGY